MHVAFSDNTETTIIAVFGCPQNTIDYPYQGELEEDDPILMAYMAPIVRYPSEVILASPNGTPFRVTIENDGTPSTKPIIELPLEPKE